MRLGVHVSIGKGLSSAVDHALASNCDGFQIFAGNPRGWSRKPLIIEEINSFKKAREKAALEPVVVHAPYLANPATNQPELYQKTLAVLTEDFHRANQLEADFFVLHPGRASDHQPGLARVIALVQQLLQAVSGKTILLLENQAGGSNEVAAELQDLQTLLSGIALPERTGICFDTCHAFAAGYDLRSAESLSKVVTILTETVGLNSLKLFHLNDAKGECGSKLDRHEHIGLGKIGLAGFEALLNHPKLSHLPGILETPQHEPGDDQRNLTTLKNLLRIPTLHEN